MSTISFDYTVARILAGLALFLSLTVPAARAQTPVKTFVEADDRAFHLFRLDPAGKTGAYLFEKETSGNSAKLNYHFIFDGQGTDGPDFNFALENDGLTLRRLVTVTLPTPVRMTSGPNFTDRERLETRMSIDGREVDWTVVSSAGKVTGPYLTGRPCVRFAAKSVDVASGITSVVTFTFVPGEGLISVKFDLPEGQGGPTEAELTVTGKQRIGASS